MNLGLLKPAYIPPLGIGMWWTVFVLTLHTVWSISVSIGLTEALVPDRASTPWLGRIGMAVTTVLFLFGAVVSTKMSLHDPFVASHAQFAWSAVACLIVIVAALLVPKPSATRTSSPGSVPGPWIVGAIALIAGSIFMTVPRAWAWRAVGIYLAMDVALIIAVYAWSRHAAWGAQHRLALAGGAALAYAWHAFIQQPVLAASPRVILIGHIVFSGSLVLLLVIAAGRNAKSSTVPIAP
jgi:hypothetical protein